MAKALGGSHDGTVTHPMPSHHSVDIDPDVGAHLFKHGYSVSGSEYVSGVARKKVVTNRGEKEVPVKIGKALEQTGADESIKNAFANDPARSAAKHSTADLAFTVSAHQYAHAAKSTNQSWAGSSCVRMESPQHGEGANCHYLREDSENGTHEFFLHKSDDPGLKEYPHIPHYPLARISAVPYHSEDSDHTIFMANPTAYGAGTSAFHQAVNDFLEKHYPAREGETYNRNERVYNDGAPSQYRENSREENFESLHAGMKLEPNRKSAGHLMEFLGDSSIDHEKKLAAIATNWHLPMDVQDVHSALSHVPDDLSSSRNGMAALRSLATRHGAKFSASNINKFQNSLFASGQIPASLLSNPRLPSDIVEKHVKPEDYGSLHPSKITDSMVDKVIDNYQKGKSGSAYPVGDMYSKGKLKGHHLERLADINLDKEGMADSAHRYNHVANALKSPLVSPEYKDTLAKRVFGTASNYGLKSVVIKHHPALTKEHADMLIPDRHEVTPSSDSADKYTFKTMTQATHPTKEYGDALIEKMHKNPAIALDSPNHQPSDAIKKHLEDNLTNEHIDHLIHSTPKVLPHGLMNINLGSRVLTRLEHHIGQHHDNIEDMYENDLHEDENGDPTPEWEHHGKKLSHLLQMHGRLMDDLFDNHFSVENNPEEHNQHVLDTLANHNYHIEQMGVDESSHDDVNGMIRNGDTYHSDVTEKISDGENELEHRHNHWDD